MLMEFDTTFSLSVCFFFNLIGIWNDKCLGKIASSNELLQRLIKKKRIHYILRG